MSATATDDTCGQSDANPPSSPLLLTSSSGLLASRLSPVACAWTIRVEPFQQIIVSLTDFEVISGQFLSLCTRPPIRAHARTHQICVVWKDVERSYAHGSVDIRERTGGGLHKTCGATVGVRHVKMDVNSVTIHQWVFSVNIIDVRCTAEPPRMSRRHPL